MLAPNSRWPGYAALSGGRVRTLYEACGVVFRKYRDNLADMRGGWQIPLVPTADGTITNVGVSVKLRLVWVHLC